MHFPDFLKTQASEIEKSLDALLSDFLSSQKNQKLKPLIKSFIAANEGGKRLRGALVILGFKLFSKSENSEIIKVAAALEIFQTAILAHDDIIDKSSMRRGEQTLFKKLGGDHYAVSQTMLLGDIGFFLASNILSESNFPEKEKIKALQLFNQMVIQVGVGEMLDVELPHLNSQTEEDVLEIHKNKTAFYTIVYPLIIGAVLGGGTDSELKKIEEFGESLGIAFQIQDDILGVFGTEETIGKSVTSDIEEGKNTLLLTEALTKGDSSQKKILGTLYGKTGVTEEDLEQIKQIFISTGALDHSRIQAVEYVNLSKKLIPEVTTDTELIELLEEMADFLVERNK